MTDAKPAIMMDLLTDGSVHVTNCQTITLSLGTNLFYSEDALAALFAENERLRDELTLAQSNLHWRDLEVVRLRKERDTFYMDYRMKCDAETKALHVELAAAQKDAERYRWLNDKRLDGWREIEAGIDAAISKEKNDEPR